MPIRNVFLICIIDLAHLHICLTKRSCLGNLPCLIRNTDDLSGIFQLEEKGKLGTEKISVSINAGITAIPAICHFCCNGIFSVFQKFCHIIGLIWHLLVIRRCSRSKDKIAHSLAVNPDLINTMCADIGSCIFGISVKSKGLAQIRYRLHLVRIDLSLRVDPFCHKLICLDNPHLKMSILTPLAADILFVPQAHMPDNLLLACKICIQHDIHAVTCYLAAVVYDIFTGLCLDLIGSLMNTILTDPGKTWLLHINPQWIFHLFTT